MVIFLAQYLTYAVFLVIPYLWIRRERHDLVRILVTVVAAFAVSEALKSFLSLPRPFVAEDFEPLIAVSQRDFYGSFPSGHTVFLAALGAAVFFTEKIPGTLIMLLAAAVGIGRVMAGVHYPVDILGGFLIGVIVAGFFKALHEIFPLW
ncbi:MAG: phosphatase PAP2 family protein [Patescibacteria group bacterium]